MINGDATATAINPPQNDNGVPFSQHMVRFSPRLRKSLTSL